VNPKKELIKEKVIINVTGWDYHKYCFISNQVNYGFSFDNVKIEVETKRLINKVKNY
jgi:hypothetical protein